MLPEARRLGDPAILVASAARAIEVLDWKPVYNSLEVIISHAWAWEKKTSFTSEGCMNYLSESDFTKTVSCLPLVSIDICLVFDGCMLLGLRNNSPAKGYWFTPGGRIRKSERLVDCKRRILNEELGFVESVTQSLELMGAWDHMYDDSAFSDVVSTHYVNLPFVLRVDYEIDLAILPQGLGEQHTEWCWYPLDKAGMSEEVHLYVQTYAKWLRTNQPAHDLK